MGETTKTDAELAADVHAAQYALNKAIDAASAAGLDIEVRSDDVIEVGRGRRAFVAVAVRRTIR